MGNIFAASEVIELGIQIEKNGRDFYNTLLKQSDSPKAKEVFSFLAAEEERHIKVFEAILSKVSKYEPAGLDSDDYYAYMNSLASEHIFTQKDKGAEVAKSIKTDKEAIDKGIRFEEDSIIFYEGMKKVVPANDQKIIDELIRQEQIHLKQLIDLKAKI
jgi:rubrerythrin